MTTKPNFDRNKYERLIRTATTEPGMRETLEEIEALVIHLSPNVDKFIKKFGCMSVDKFLQVLPYAPIDGDLRGFFKVQASDEAVQFYMCAYQTSMSAELDTFVVYICTQSEDEEFGIIDTLLQASNNQLPNLLPNGLPASIAESAASWNEIDNIDWNDLEDLIEG
ncbi:hypothetical protein [Vibrio sp. McD22-P3]|uniref:hypothetical protein n=1 Tax=Vibrio sp. McD22-P3 TaxID=2724880 RepID=UPI001F2A2B32|nr:hypothetical protein [Vibrio sp. McD22-P3]MCF4174304.1 hypothetical protein [Vibrio sp. McD22-P3]